MTHRWRLPNGGQDVDTAQRSADEALARSLGVPPLIARLLRARGMDEASAARAFCSPVLTGLSDPALIPGLSLAADRIIRALTAGERIAIYGDYDVDGVAATAILHHVMRAIAPGCPLEAYVPHRLEEGYGLNADAIRELAARNVRLIVSVDCGITAIEPARVARECGVDLVITDHHNPRADGQLPHAVAIVHPRVGASAAKESDAWRELSGAGVAFLLAWRLASLAAGGGRVGPDMQRLLLDLLALAALGTVADVVPLVGDNRIIARHGLARVRSTALIGLGALVAESGLVGADIDAEAAGFAIGPRLNACGRMGHAKEAVELFITQDVDRASEIARRLGQLNRERQSAERRIVDEATQAAEAQGMTVDGWRAIVLSSREWHRGIVGIACSRLISRYRRPTILLHEGDDGVCRGSGRSIDGYNMHGALQACSMHLESFGGHDMAAGVAVRMDRLRAFIDAMVAHAREHVTDDMMTPALQVDCEATLDELIPDVVRALTMLGPFGRGNATPRILVRDVRCTEMPRPMGAHARHISMHVRSNGSQQMRLIAWGWGERAERLAGAVGVPMSIVVTPKLNDWGGMLRVEAELVDLALTSV